MNYYYWAATLPLLKFDEPSVPASAAAAFGERFSAELAPEDAANLSAASLLPDAEVKVSGALAEYWRYETNLRNAILRRRSARTSDPAQYLRPEQDYFSDIGSVVQEAAALSALDREKAVDRARWAKLDELEARHAVDGDFFVIYKLRLAILEKYAGRTAAAGEAGFGGAVDSVLAGLQNSNMKQGA